METAKRFTTYTEASAVYSEIVSGRDPDRKNASIVYEKVDNVTMPFIVIWEKK